jgi:hypothetical protein
MIGAARELFRRSPSINGVSAFAMLLILSRISPRFRGVEYLSVRREKPLAALRLKAKHQ